MQKYPPLRPYFSNTEQAPQMHILDWSIVQEDL
jgi:hypothetical protein